LFLFSLVPVYFVFFTMVAIDPNCDGCERADWEQPYKAIVNGEKILGPYFLHPLFSE
jgi:hypothetical protein